MTHAATLNQCSRDGEAARPLFFDDLVFGIDLTPEPSFDVLIGMDVPSKVDLRIERNRNYSLTF